LTNDQHAAANSALTQQVQSLTSQMELLRCGATTSGTHDDHVQFLTEQAKQFHADFESEKRDRIAAEARIAELQQQLAATNRQVN